MAKSANLLWATFLHVSTYLNIVLHLCIIESQIFVTNYLLEGLDIEPNTKPCGSPISIILGSEESSLTNTLAMV